jgi:maleate isomerase
MTRARAKLGVIVLSTNLAVEDEFRRIVPEDVGYYVARCFIPDADESVGAKEAELRGLQENVLLAARQVAMARPDVILFACTIGSMLGGEGHDTLLSDAITQVTGIPGITTGTAVLEALRRLGARKMSLVDPYPPALGEAERKYLEAAVPGLRVVSTKHLGVVSSYEKNLLSRASALRAARETVVAEAQALFISCTAWATLDVIEPLERELGIPVITSTQASLWACLRRCGLPDVLPHGKLFEL